MHWEVCSQLLSCFGFAVCVADPILSAEYRGLYRRLTDGRGVRLWKNSQQLGITGVITSWITLTLKGLFVAKGNTIGPRPPSNDRHDFLARMAPPVFVLGLVAMLSWLVLA